MQKSELDKSYYERKRAEAISVMGGKCATCGRTDNLHFDHIDHRAKTRSIDVKRKDFLAAMGDELQNCQLLCADCHLEKSRKEGSLAKGWTNQPQGMKHGTYWTYTKYRCRCEPCRAAKATHRRKYGE